jgi:hypothetical protein
LLGSVAIDQVARCLLRIWPLQVAHEDQAARRGQPLDLTPERDRVGHVVNKAGAEDDVEGGIGQTSGLGVDGLDRDAIGDPAIFTEICAMRVIALAASTAVMCQSGRALATMIGTVPGPVPRSTIFGVFTSPASWRRRLRSDSMTSGNFAAAYARASSGRSISSGSG